MQRNGIRRREWKRIRKASGEDEEKGMKEDEKSIK
jgi:hypothetical protein